MRDKEQSLQGDKMNRRGFLKGLGAVVAIPVAIKAVAAKPELSNLEKARQIDQNFDSPFLYVQASEDLKQGDIVMFDSKSEYYPYAVKKCGSGRSKSSGISCADVKKDSWFFVQTVGHCKLPVRDTNYFKKFGI